jgi:hypothetical protein
MTEAEWLAHKDPFRMFELLRDGIDERKLRLFFVGYCRSLWPLLRLPERDLRHSRDAADAAERFADGLAGPDDLQSAHLDASDAYAYMPDHHDLWAAGCLATSEAPARAWTKPLGAKSRKREMAYALLRDIFGNPFRPAVLDPSWLAWHDGAVRKMAQAIYDERRFADLPILADALEDAGCTDATILAHCRGRGEHVRGCWVVDLLLGKA